MLRKFTGPGLFRLFLALMVFVHHITRFAVGTSAVYIFFCLSGYWIYKMYTGRYSGTRQPYLTYIASRAWRLLPTFVLITLITLIFLYFNGSLARYWYGSNPIHFILSNLFIVGYESLPMQPIVPAWSLDIEMQFYLIAPLIVIALARHKVHSMWFLLTAGAVSASSYFLHNPVSSMNYLVFFVFGLTAASVDWRPGKMVAFLSLGGTALLTVCCLFSPWRGVLLLGAHPGPLSIYSPEANVALGLLMAPYAIYTTGQKGFGLDGMFADLSYVIYLLHWPAVAWIGSHRGGRVERLTYSLIGVIVVIGMSLAIWRFYDYPINRMRSRWVSSRKKGKSMLQYKGVKPGAGVR